MPGLKLVDLSEQFVLELFDWRRKPSLGNLMGKPFDADYDQHLAWCRNAINDDGSIHTIAVVDNLPIAYCSAKDYLSDFPLGGFVLGDEKKSYLCLSILRMFYGYLCQQKGVTKLFGYMSCENSNMRNINRVMGWVACKDKVFAKKISDLGVDLTYFDLIELDMGNGRY